VTPGHSDTSMKDVFVTHSPQKYSTRNMTVSSICQFKIWKWRDRIFVATNEFEI